MFKDQYEIIEHRYLRRNKNGEIIEYPEQMADRVATFIALSEPRDRTNGFDKLNKWYPIFLDMLLNMKVSPNTPTWSSAGIPGFGCFACAVVENGDSLEEISNWYHDVLFMNRYNFGIGHSLHRFRPENSPFGNAKTKTKSPLKWLNIVQELATSMQQGDSGRGGANMVSIPIWHPSVIEFINYKQYPEDIPVPARKLMKDIMNSNLDVNIKETIIDVIDKSIPLKNFNLSVLITDKFMKAVENDSKWELKFELSDRSWEFKKEVRAKKLWEQIVKNAYENGDPGLMFFDNINKDNHIDHIRGKIYCSNPCGEQFLHSNSICNLWTINLVKHLDFYHKKINWSQLNDTINVVTRMADNLITQNEYPKEVPKLEKQEKEERRIGIDYTGLADILYILEIKYGSNHSYNVVSDLYKFLRDNTRKTSAVLGKKKGNFPLFGRTKLKSKDSNDFSLKKCPDCKSKLQYSDTENFIECTNCSWVKYKFLRNLELTTQAPTGTRSRKLGVSFGLEPHFAKWWKSNVLEGKTIYNMSRIFEWYLRQWSNANNYSIEEGINFIETNNPIISMITKNWVETYDLSPEQHLEIQVRSQQFVSNAISKTINFDSSTTVDDIDKIYKLAWKKGLKGVTIYRKGSHFREVIGEDEKCPECSSTDILAIEGCKICKNCQWGACSN